VRDILGGGEGKEERRDSRRERERGSARLAAPASLGGGLMVE